MAGLIRPGDMTPAASPRERGPGAPATDRQWGLLRAGGDRLGWDRPYVFLWLRMRFGVHPETITARDAHQALAELRFLARTGAA